MSSNPRVYCSEPTCRSWVTAKTFRRRKLPSRRTWLCSKCQKRHTDRLLEVSMNTGVPGYIGWGE